MDDDTERIRVYSDDKRTINNLRQGDDTQADVVQRLLENPTPPQEDVETISDALADDEVAIVGSQNAVVDELAERLETAASGDTSDDVRDALATLEERTGRIEQTLENLGGRR